MDLCSTKPAQSQRGADRDRLRSNALWFGSGAGNFLSRPGAQQGYFKQLESPSSAINHAEASI
jgi:hypothetical protein